ncbi:hypothetical protein Ade02nite_73910 [Paractinoplanes deccanensis]|uniref:Uncharacterized protein n=1 Tax=Paractinoplanes deccanensis TaxID=113561 RepID=A0ABQ3YG45_9ACTN|nr:hypothetical protein Ade02nite_73910 [Actinoplanes deccanensis]
MTNAATKAITGELSRSQMPARRSAGRSMSAMPPIVGPTVTSAVPRAAHHGQMPRGEDLAPPP